MKEAIFLAAVDKQTLPTGVRACLTVVAGATSGVG